jgi:hypothetical protein
VKAPTFISNTADDAHCVQACVGMVLKYFLPHRSFSMRELEYLTGFVPSKGAWEMEELLNYPKLGLEAVITSDFSYKEFAKRGFEYLREIDGPEVAQWSIDNTGDIELEKRRANEVAKKNVHIQRTPNQEDIGQYLADGWLVMLGVNARKLNGNSGFVGHRVLIYMADKAGVTMHDPGSPPYLSRKVNWQLLESSWADPNEASKMLIAVRLAKA